MRRWLGRIFTTLSLMLLIATAGIWAESQRHWRIISRTLWVGTGDRASVGLLGFEAWRGSLETGLYCFTHDLSAPGAPEQFRRDLSAHPLYSYHSGRPATFQLQQPNQYPVVAGGKWWGFGWERVELLRSARAPRPRFLNSNNYGLYAESYTSVILPWWFLTLCFAVLPARAVYIRTRRRRGGKAAHCCPVCGYDCRATPDPLGPRLSACPECGRVDVSGSGTIND